MIRRHSKKILRAARGGKSDFPASAAPELSPIGRNDQKQVIGVRNAALEDFLKGVARGGPPPSALQLCTVASERSSVRFTLGMEISNSP